MNARHVLGLVLWLAGTGSGLFAQAVGETTGTLVGSISDETGAPLPGTAVTVDGNTGRKSTTSDADGKFVFPYLIPGTYSLEAELDGWRTIELASLTIHLNERVEIPLQMSLELTESYDVFDEVPLIEKSSTTTGSNIPEELIDSLPISRSFTATITLSPGASEAGVGGNPSISGASGLENTYIIDGVNITDPGYGAAGAYSAKFGSMGSGFPPDVVKEVQVMTGGFEPEYGQALGGVVNVITRSGGNELAGEAFVYWSPGDLEGERRAVDLQESLVVNRAGAENLDGGFHVGGPILADRLFFFAAYNRRREETTFANDPDAPHAEEFPSTTNVRNTDAYAAKATATPTSSHIVELGAYGDPGSSRLANQNGFGLESLDPAGKMSSLEYGGNSQVLRWSGVIGSGLFVEAQAARSQTGFEEILGPAADQRRVIDRTVRPAAQSGGLGIFDAGSEGTNLQYAAKGTSLWRRHELRFGAQLEEISYAGGQDRSGEGFRISDGRVTTDGPRIVVQPGGLFGLPVEKVYQAFGSLSPTRRPTTTEYLNLFVQDSWSVTSRLSARFGIRWEEQRLKGDSPGSTDVTFSDNWAPRIGLTYDLMGDGRSKLFAHAGRYFEKIPNGLAARAFSGGSDVVALFYDLALTQPVPGRETITEFSAGGVEGLGDSTSPFTTRAQYSDEVVAGIEMQVGRDTTLGARAIFRTLGRVLEDIAVDLTAPCVPGYLGTDLCVPPGLTAEASPTATAAFFITNVDGHYPGYPALEREYRALELTAQKRFADGWQLLGSYRYAQLEGNYEGSFRRDNGDTDPHLSTLADNAESPWLAYTFEKGPLPNEIEHTVKLFGSYRWQGGWNAGAALGYASGRPITELGGMPFLTGFSRERVLSPRGSYGRTDALTTLDLRAAWDIRLPGERTLTLGVDVFNVFDAQGVTTVAENSEISNGTFAPDPNADFLRPTAYQAPRSIRFLVKYSR